MWQGDTFGGYWLIVALWLSGFFILYFILLNGTYLSFIISGVLSLRRYAHDAAVSSNYSLLRSALTKPISVLVPAYNEERNIIETVTSLLLLHYPRFEVIIINDGSSDETLQRLIDHFGLVERHKVYRRKLNSSRVRAIYESPKNPELVVIDKENGGKSDALNCGINVSSFPFFCVIDADTVLEEDSLLKMVRPFLDQPESMVAVGGIVRVANNCTVERGHVIDIRLPHSLIELIQVLEYLQAFLSSRIAFSSANAVLLVSGAFGLFRKDVVIDVGGYKRTIGEDMELVVRMQRLMLKARKPCQMVFVPDPVCWTEVPRDWRSLSSQRRRWQKGLIDSIHFNSEMLFNPRFGRLGLLAMPYYLIFEMLGPILELFGYATMVLFLMAGVLSWQWAGLFFLVSIGFGVLISSGAILLEELSFHRYPRPRQVLALLLGALLYNLGYRQINALWRFSATFEYVGGFRLWGRIKRFGFKTGAKEKATT